MLAEAPNLGRMGSKMSEQIFKDRTAIVTGGGRGIGRSICQMLADHGARVAVIFAENQQAADETVSMIAGQAERAMAVQADVSQATDVDRMIQTVREQLGPIDFLVNNAGIASTTSHQDLNFDDWKRMSTRLSASSGLASGCLPTHSRLLRLT